MEENRELVGNMSGTKLFVLGAASIFGPWLMLTGQWIGYTGVSVILAFIVCGVLCIPIGLCYGELAAMFKNKGGSYEYVKFAFSNNAGYWVSWFTMFTYISLIVFQVICVTTLVGFAFDIEMSQATIAIVCVALMILLLIMNSLGSDLAGSLQMVFCFILLAAGLIFSMAFIFGGHWSPDMFGDFFQQGMVSHSDYLGMDTGFFMAVAGLVTMFFGFELMPAFAGESSYPSSKYWKLMVGAIVVVIAFDSLICLAECGMTPIPEYGAFSNSYDFISYLYVEKGGFVSAILADYYYGGWLKWIIMIGNFCCMACCLIGFWLGGSRIVHSMGNSSSLPGIFGLANKRGAPTWGNYLVFILAFALCMIALSGEKWINATFSLMALGCGFTYLGVALAYIKLKRDRPDIERSWKAPAGMAMGVIAVIASAFMAGMMVYTVINSAINGDPIMLYMTIVFFAIVALLYAYMKYDEKKHPDRYYNEDKKEVPE